MDTSYFTSEDVRAVDARSLLCLVPATTFDDALESYSATEYLDLQINPYNDGTVGHIRPAKQWLLSQFPAQDRPI